MTDKNNTTGKQDSSREQRASGSARNRADEQVHEAMQDSEVDVRAEDIKGLEGDTNRADEAIFEAEQDSLHDNISGAKINPMAAGSGKTAPTGPSKRGVDPHPEPFEDQQDPRRPIGQHNDKGRPPLMKK